MMVSQNVQRLTRDIWTVMTAAESKLKHAPRLYVERATQSIPSTNKVNKS